MGVRLPLFVVTIILCQYVLSFPSGGDPTDALIVSSTEINERPVSQDEAKKVPPPELDSMHVISNVNNRYAQTIISSRYKNPASLPQETTFSIVLPETAFITGFLMHIKDKSYEAYVREKEVAKQEYDFAVAHGNSAAHVAVNARDSNRFTVSMNIEPNSKVTFNLTYEELLVRKHGNYELVFNLHPGQLVKDLTVDVNINEAQPLVNVNTPAIRSGNDILEDGKKNEFAEIEKIGDENKSVHVHFAPTVKQQKQMAKDLGSVVDDGIAGQFVIEYDVERDSKGGEILVNDGYFVHFFAPPDLKTLPKYVVFVLDVSGSMIGRKIDQLKSAMQAILVQLGPNDYFNLVEFNSNVKIYNLHNIDKSTTLSNYGYFGYYNNEEQTKPASNFELLPAYPATAANKEAATAIIKNMDANGGTNIYDALEVALNMTAAFIMGTSSDKTAPQPLIIFLTDGDPTVGNTNTNDILDIVAKRNTDKNTTIFSLAFGSDTDKQLLKSVSLKNNGFMRQIYEASDAALQLQDFYKQIASPLLANVTFTYPDSDALTQNVFHNYFGGSELIVSGKIKNPENGASVHGITLDGPIDFIPILTFADTYKRQLGSLERLWAYTTIRQLLDKKDELENDKDEEKKKEIKAKALKLALQYSFVTPLTSLVVVKPNATQHVNTEEASGANRFNSYAQQSFPLSLSGAGAIPLVLNGQAGVPRLPVHNLYPTTPFYPTTTFVNKVAYATTVITDSEKSQIIPKTIIPEIPWLSAVLTSDNHINLNGKLYEVGDNSTVVDSITCTVDKLYGSCTVLSACPSIYAELDTFETYHNKYFCPLALDKVAGVCCIDTEDE